MRTQQILMARIEATLKPFGLTFARYELLALLSFARGGALPMNKASALRRRASRRGLFRS